MCNVCGILHDENEKGMGALLKHVAHENRSDDLVKQLRKVGSAFLTHREVSAQEAAYRLLLPMRQLSRSVVFINTNRKEGCYKRPSDLDKCSNCTLVMYCVLYVCVVM